MLVFKIKFGADAFISRRNLTHLLHPESPEGNDHEYISRSSDVLYSDFSLNNEWLHIVINKNQQQDYFFLGRGAGGYDS